MEREAQNVTFSFASLPLNDVAIRLTVAAGRNMCVCVCLLGMDYQQERGREFKKALTGGSVGGFVSIIGCNCPGVRKNTNHRPGRFAWK